MALTTGIIALARGGFTKKSSKAFAIVGIVLSSVIATVLLVIGFTGGSKESTATDAAPAPSSAAPAPSSAAPAPSASPSVDEPAYNGAGWSSGVAGAICPFVNRFWKDHPGVGDSISLAVAGQTQTAALMDVVAVGQVAQAIQGAASRSPGLDAWMAFASGIDSPEYSALQFIPNDAEASAGLTALRRFCK